METSKPAGDEEEIQPRKPSRTILKQEIVAGLTELRRPTAGLFLSSLSGGLDIGFSVLLIGVVHTHLGEDLGPAWTRVAAAMAYSVGFILVILGRSELFTEHTALATLPVLDGRSSIRDLLRVWGVVFCGNAVGAVTFAWALQLLAPAMGAAEPWAFELIARNLIDHPWWVILLSGVFAGWLMGDLGWLVAASRETVSQILCVAIITSAIGLAHLHHVVVGTAEVATGFFLGALSLADAARFVVWAGVGNAIGGVVFVGIIKYGHAIRTDEEPEDVDELNDPEKEKEPDPAAGIA